jgi:hypothetical protein
MERVVPWGRGNQLMGCAMCEPLRAGGQPGAEGAPVHRVAWTEALARTAGGSDVCHDGVNPGFGLLLRDARCPRRCQPLASWSIRNASRSPPRRFRGRQEVVCARCRWRVAAEPFLSWPSSASASRVRMASSTSEWPGSTTDCRTSCGGMRGVHPWPNSRQHGERARSGRCLHPWLARGSDQHHCYAGVRATANIPHSIDGPTGRIGIGSCRVRIYLGKPRLPSRLHAPASS